MIDRVGQGRLRPVGVYLTAPRHHRSGKLKFGVPSADQGDAGPAQGQRRPVAQVRTPPAKAPFALDLRRLSKLWISQLGVTATQCRGPGGAGGPPAQLRALRPKGPLRRRDCRGRGAVRSDRRLTDEEAVAQLTATKGVGRWTAETYLPFSEGAPRPLSGGGRGPAGGLSPASGRREASRRKAALRTCRGVATLSRSRGITSLELLQSDAPARDEATGTPVE
jgi:hypothetical protein